MHTSQASEQPLPSREQFFAQLATETDARYVAWKLKFSDRDFHCARCGGDAYYSLRSVPEIRECQACGYHVRLRVGLPMGNSKLPLLTWMIAAYLLMRFGRVFSARRLQHELRLSRYATAHRLYKAVSMALEDVEFANRFREVVAHMTGSSTLENL